MRRILLIHIVFLIVAIGAFYSLGFIDKNRLEEASPTNKPTLIFAHDKLLIEDGGSILWVSLIYTAREKRAAIITKKRGVKRINPFQGTTWVWKHSNLIWIALMVIGSFVSFQVIRKFLETRRIQS